MSEQVHSRKTVQDVFIRVCRDSMWQIDAINAAKLTASVVGKHPLQVWSDVGSLDIMNQIAAGTHPVCTR